MAEAKQAPRVTCPQCGRKTVYSSSNAFRPFCSERCKLIDLGRWASESYRVPAEDTPNLDDADRQEG